MGKCVIRTALSVVLTDCPPAPEARMTSILISRSFTAQASVPPDVSAIFDCSPGKVPPHLLLLLLLLPLLLPPLRFALRFLRFLTRTMEEI